MGKLKTTKVRQAINVANRYSDVDMKEVSASKPVIKKRIEDILIDQNIEEHGENFLRVAKDTLKTHRRLGSSMSQSELESRPLQSLIYSIKNTDNFANRYLTAKILGKGKKNDLRNLENRISDYQKKRCEISSKQNLSLPRIESSIQTHQTPVKVVHKFNAFTFSQSKILVESESKDRNYNSKNIDLNSIAAKTSRGKFLLHFEKRDPL